MGTSDIFFFLHLILKPFINTLSNKSNNFWVQAGSGEQQCSLSAEIAKARQHIKSSLEKVSKKKKPNQNKIHEISISQLLQMDALVATPGAELLERLTTVEKENSSLHGSEFLFFFLIFFI